MALSHLHADYVGNVGLFPKATFLVAAAELAWARVKPAPISVDARYVSLLAQARMEAVDEDRDVFGNGSVRILKAPGHTPGHRVLLVKLAQAGPLLVTGDLQQEPLTHPRGLRERAGGKH